jgi:hypothetical protein
MDNIPAVVYFALFMLAALWIAALVTQDRDRQEIFKKTAQRLGLRYEPSANELIEAYGVLPLFGRGRERLTSNVIQGGSSERPEAVFDYQYTLEGGKEDSAIRQTVAVFRLDGMNLPHFTLEPQGTAFPIEGLFGYGDIDFLQEQQFSNVYHLRGQDVVHVQQCFQPNVLTQLLQEPGWHVEGADNRLVVYHPMDRVKHEELAAFIEGASRIARILCGT